MRFVVLGITIPPMDIEEAIKDVSSFRELASALDLPDAHRKQLKQQAVEMGLDFSHFRNQPDSYGKLLGEKYMKLTPVEVFKRGKRTFLRCECDCGGQAELRADGFSAGRYISCGCVAKRRESIAGSLNPAWKGIGDIPASLVKAYARGAERRNISFDITIEEMWEIFERQGGKCALSGVALYFGRVRKHAETNASLDRIDSSLGYSLDNCQWLHKDINMMKGVFEQQYFLELCETVVKANRTL